MARREQLEARTVEQLRKIAREAGHESVGRLRKAELVTLILNSKTEASAETPASREAGGATIGRWLGGLMQIFGGGGIALTAACVLLLPFAAVWGGGAASDRLEASAAMVRRLGETTGNTRQVLISGEESLRSAAQTLRTVRSSIVGAEPLLEDTSDLLGDELPASIESVQSSLLAAEEGARAMDRVLRGLRLLGLDYDPEQALDESLAVTAGSLDSLPDSLRTTSESLDRSRRDLGLVRQDLGLLAANLEGLAEELSGTVDGLADQEQELNLLAQKLEQGAERAGRTIWLGAMAVAVALVWLLLVNVAMLLVGGRLRVALGVTPPEGGPV